MFDLVTGKARRLPSHSTLPILISTTAQALAGAAALVIPALFVAEQIPEIPTMLAFVAPPPSPPAPPPPPAQRAAAVKPVTQPQHVPSTPEVITAVEAPHATATEPTGPPAVEDGVPGGVEGGVPGGIIGGLLSGVPEPPPPAPPPAPAAHEPVRIGGDIQPPALVHRVEPVYPPAAVAARLQGIVILEALVDREGLVTEVKVLRSAGSILDRQALAAVKQWRYSPFLRNGLRERFVLTVTLSFSVQNEA
jgi:periplasmic protein TonB